MIAELVSGAVGGLVVLLAGRVLPERIERRELREAHLMIEPELGQLRRHVEQAEADHDVDALTALPEAPRWDEYQRPAARASVIDYKMISAAYSSVAALRAAALVLEDIANDPTYENIAADLHDLVWNLAGASQRLLRHAEQHVTPRPSRPDLLRRRATRKLGRGRVL